MNYYKEITLDWLELDENGFWRKASGRVICKKTGAIFDALDVRFLGI